MLGNTVNNSYLIKQYCLFQANSMKQVLFKINGMIKDDFIRKQVSTSYKILYSVIVPVHNFRFCLVAKFSINIVLIRTLYIILKKYVRMLKQHK